MARVLPELSITRQFSLIAGLGVLLTLAGLGLTLKRGYDLAFETKRDEARHLTEAAASLIRAYVEREKRGALTLADAQARAAAALDAMRFDQDNFFIAYAYDGTTLAFPKKSVIGTNRLAVTDSNGKAYVKAFIDVAKSGQPGFVDYEFPKPNETEPSPKMSYAIGIPEWRWVVASGIYVDNINQKLIGGARNLATVFLPFLVVFLLIVLVMRRALILLLASQKDAEDNRRGIEDERHRKSEIERRATQAKGVVVESLGSALARLSLGDLTLNVEETYAAEYETIRQNFNAAVAQLREAMSHISDNTMGIRSGTIEIASASDDLARRTECQAVALAETAITLCQIANAVGETAQGATAAREIVATALQDAERGKAVVREAIEAMSAIEASARQIAQVSGVINNIAFQTNLLALNAGVEAARAGDAGKGFAVVANEIRGLAKRSADAAKDIKALILISSTQVGRGVAHVAGTGTALERICGGVAEMNALVVKIASSAQQQAKSLTAVNKAVEEMDKVTQLNAAMVEESTAASHSLASEADVLAHMVGRFSLGSPAGLSRAVSRA